MVLFTLSLNIVIIRYFLFDFQIGMANPAAINPSPKLSALVSACRRVKAFGKRSNPTVPARKKKEPAMNSIMVKLSTRFIVIIVC
jgi:hypothetical protein